MKPDIRYSPIGYGKKLHKFIDHRIISVCGRGWRFWDWDEYQKKPNPKNVCKDCERKGR